MWGSWGVKESKNKLHGELGKKKQEDGTEGHMAGIHSSDGVPSSL